MKSKKIQLKAEIEDFGLQKSITLLVNTAQSKELVIPLLLLREGLVDSLELILDNLSICLKLDNKGNRSLCGFFNIPKKTFRATISMNSLEFAIFYLLKYIRDEIGEVDHIDLDFEYENERIVTIIIKVDSYKEISAEEMNKLLGL